MSKGPWLSRKQEGELTASGKRWRRKRANDAAKKKVKSRILKTKPKKTALPKKTPGELGPSGRRIRQTRAKAKGLAQKKKARAAKKKKAQKKQAQKTLEKVASEWLRGASCGPFSGEETAVTRELTVERFVARERELAARERIPVRPLAGLLKAYAEQGRSKGCRAARRVFLEEATWSASAGADVCTSDLTQCIGFDVHRAIDLMVRKCRVESGDKFAHCPPFVCTCRSHPR